MSAIFDGYEREYCELSTQLGRKISQLGSLSGGECRARVPLSLSLSLISSSTSLFFFLVC